MKKLLVILLIPAFVFSQIKEDLDFIAPFSDGVAAIKKGNSWGFIDEKGEIAVAFRDDLVLTETDGYNYPMFKNNRCLISEIKNGITYFGYIDKTGKTIIAPQFLNASNFYHNKAIALQVLKKELGTSNALGKNLVSYRYFEVTIDANGSVEDYLNPSGVNVVLDKEFLRNPPKITSKQISDNIYAVRGENNKWNIVICNN